ncbi:helix-turn-helix transcriptional regulator [Paenibacillus apiarius]|uniref:helix-turn-helix transcriptional regulator n=1 Tax=Paenibacillus apiarius TaxID=46240 RepID=UPI00197CF768|nr:metalloregulator ArsR/SmtB family transcription factor [Paenibacillus apiarius]MBN3525258.1 transcriptional regulator [Paenibacillus apiarius]
MMIAHEARLLKQSTRRDILMILKQQGPITVQLMAEQLHITGMAVRRHLYELQKGGYVHIQLVRQSVGRPNYEYSLSDKANSLFVNKYDALALDMIEEMQAMAGHAFVEQLFERRKLKLEQKYARKLKGLKLEQRVQVLADIQDREGYMVKWGRNVNGSFWLEEANCPISYVAAKYSPPCQCELALFADLLEAEVERTECMAQGGRKCMYRITEKQACTPLAKQADGDSGG